MMDRSNCCCNSNPPGTRCYKCQAGEHTVCTDSGAHPRTRDEDLSTTLLEAMGDSPRSNDNVNRDPNTERPDSLSEFFGKLFAVCATVIVFLIVLLFLAAYVIKPAVIRLFS